MAFLFYLKDMKKCSKCLEDKDEFCFRSKFDKRSEISYLNNTCRECDAANAREYYRKNKNDAEFKKKNILNAERYRKNYPEKYRHQRNDYYQSDIGKAKRKNYYQKNREHILILNRINNTKYTKKLRDNLDDKYVLNNMSRDLGMLKKDIKQQFPELLELTKQYIKLLRQTKK